MKFLNDEVDYEAIDSVGSGVIFSVILDSGPNHLSPSDRPLPDRGPTTIPWRYLWGSELWRDQVNAAGGIKAGGKSDKVQFANYDDESNSKRVQQF